ncbi:hypothetical protein D6833_08130, partial [Candidatus Parcubacteria bacterium]
RRTVANVAASSTAGGAMTLSLVGAPAWVTVSGTQLVFNPPYSVVAHPAKTKAGTFTVKATDRIGYFATAKVSYTINDVNRAPVFSVVANQTVVEGTTQTVTLKASDPDGDKITYVKARGPVWAKITGSAMTLTPPKGSAGAYTVTIAAKDGYGGVAYRSFKITVLKPTIVIKPFNAVANEGSKTIVPVSATSTVGGAITLSLVGAPAWVTVSGTQLVFNPPYSVVAHPAKSKAGTFTIVATDRLGYKNQAIGRYTINDVNQAPTFPTVKNLTVYEGSNNSVIFHATDPDGDKFSYVVVKAPAWSTLAGGKMTFAPPKGSAGLYSVTVGAKDVYGVMSTQTFQVKVLKPIPTISPIQPVVAPEGKATYASVSYVSPAGLATTLSLVGAPTWVSISGSKLLFNPPYSVVAHPARTKAGTFTVKATNSFGYSSTAIVSYTINDTNRAPTFPAIAKQVMYEGTTKTVTFAATDPDGDKITYTATNAPAWAKIVGNAMTLTPPKGSAGTYTIAVAAKDGFGGVANRSFVLTVNRPIPAINPIAPITAPEGRATTSIVTTTSNSGTVTLSLVGAPAWVAVSGSKLVLNPPYSVVAHPAKTKAGTFTVKATNKLGYSATATVNYTIMDTNRSPVFPVIPNTTTFETTTKTVTFAATDPDGDKITYTATNAPAWAKIVGNAMTLTPPKGSAGTYTIAVAAKDGFGGVAYRSFVLTVYKPIPSINPVPAVTVSEAGRAVTLVTVNKQTSGPVTFQLVGAPAWVKFINPQLIFTPPYSVVAHPATSKKGSFKIKVTNSLGYSNTTVVNYTVNDTNRAPVFPAVAAIKTYEGATASATFKATDPDGDKITYQVVTGPAWSKIVGNKITFNPPKGSAGTHTFTVAAKDGFGGSTTTSITVTVLKSRPTFGPMKAINVSEGKVSTVAINVYDVSGLPVTLALGTGAPKWISVSGTSLTFNPPFSFVAHPATSKAASVSVIATNSFGGQTMGTIKFTVLDTNQKPIFSPIPTVNAYEGGGTSVALKATDPDGDKLVFTVVKGPAWATTNGNMLTVAPPAGVTGTFSATIQVKDPYGGTAQQTCTIKVTKPIPTIQTIQPLKLFEAQTVNVQVNASTPAAGPLSLKLVGNPAWITLSGATIVINPSYSVVKHPSLSIKGTFTIVATNKVGGTSQQVVSYTLNDVNRKPVFSAIPAQNIYAGTTNTYALKATDADGDKLTFSVANPPFWMKLTGNTVTMAPPLGVLGAYTVTFTVKDGFGGSATQKMNITITKPPVNIKPIAPVTVNEAATKQITVNATTPAPAAMPITLKLIGAPAWAKLTGSTIVLSPSYSVVAHPSRKISGTFKVQGTNVSGATATTTVSYTVNDVNRAPSFPAIPKISVLMGATKNINLTATDPDGDKVSFVLAKGPAWATIKGNTLTIKPPVGSVGTHSVTITAKDGFGGATNQTTTITVIDSTPKIQPIPQTKVFEGKTATVNVVASAPGGPVTLKISGNPGWATLKGSTITFAPPYSYVVHPAKSKTGKFTVTATNVFGISATASVSFTVIDVNRAPSFPAVPNVTIYEGATKSVTFSATDPDGDKITYTAVKAPAWSKIAGNSMSFAPPKGSAGTYTVTVAAKDGFGGVANRSFTVTVKQPIPTISPLAPVTVKENAKATVAVKATTPAAGPVTISLVNPPAWASVVKGQIVVAPTFATVAHPALSLKGSLTVKATNKFGYSSTAQLPFTVVDVNQVPALAKVPTVHVYQGQTASVVLKGSDPDGDKITYSLVNPPFWAGIKGSTVTFAPKLNTPAQTYTITASATDAYGGKATATITVVVMRPAVHIDPIAPVTVKENAKATVTVFATTPAAGPVTLSLSGAPKWVTLANNTITFAPSYGVVVHPATKLTGSFAVVAFNRAGSRATQIVNYTVIDVNRPPVFPAVPNVTVKENTTKKITFGATDPDGDKLTYSMVKGPKWCVITGSTMTISPPAGAAGKYTVTVKVADKFGGSATRTFTVTVPKTQSAVALAGKFGRVFLSPFEITRNITYKVVPGQTLPSKYKYCKDTGRSVCSPNSPQKKICLHEVNGTCLKWKTVCLNMDKQFDCVQFGTVDVSAEVQATTHERNVLTPGATPIRATDPYGQTTTTSTTTKVVKKGNCHYVASTGNVWNNNGGTRTRLYSLKRVKVGTITVTRTFNYKLTNDKALTFNAKATSAKTGAAVANFNITKSSQYCTPNALLPGTKITNFQVVHYYNSSGGNFYGILDLKPICQQIGITTMVRANASVNADGTYTCRLFGGTIQHDWVMFKNLKSWTKLNPALAYAGWAGQFGCFQNPPVEYKHNGCTGYECSASFRV